MGRRLAHASSLTYRFWGDASRDLNAELGKLCPFSAPRGHTFSTCPPRFPPKGISWANFHP